MSSAIEEILIPIWQDFSYAFSLIIAGQVLTRVLPQYPCKGMAICRQKRLVGIIIPSLSLYSQMSVNLLLKNRLQGSESGGQTPVLEI